MATGLDMTSLEHLSRPPPPRGGGADSHGDEDFEPRPHPPHSASTTKVFPLNSKRLTSQYVMALAKAMGLPTKGSVEETRLIIEGSLTDMDREPRNVQVQVVDGDPGAVMIYLCDSQSVFVEAYVGALVVSGAEGRDLEDDREEDSLQDGVGAESESDVPDALLEARARNRELQELNSELSAQVSGLKGEVDALADKLKHETERSMAHEL